MSIDEAIKHCEEVAENKQRQVDEEAWEKGSLTEKKCLECASEHRQLAEWLRELKAYREAEKEIEQELVNWNDIDNGKCRGLFLATSIIQHYKNEEVNADDKR